MPLPKADRFSTCSRDPGRWCQLQPSLLPARNPNRKQINDCDCLREFPLTSPLSAPPLPPPPGGQALYEPKLAAMRAYLCRGLPQATSSWGQYMILTMKVVRSSKPAGPLGSMRTRVADIAVTRTPLKTKLSARPGARTPNTARRANTRAIIGSKNVALS